MGWAREKVLPLIKGFSIVGKRRPLPARMRRRALELEQTVFENNLEAAEEIARQLRLRDIGGIIVIDFIDMETQKRQQELLSKFKQELAKDKTRTQVFDISRLGLVEMTRKNVSAGLIESFSDECEECNGRGLIIGDIFSNNSVDTDLLESEAVVE